ncbi:MAG: hypothetical protein KF858_13245 [Candidatus Sumerlaeia bacterium]|nr:hypothetical protein [Candidatus Sumerlaeia bacterium]
MSNYVLDRAYRVEEVHGVGRYRVVTAGTQSDGCRYPSGPNAGPVLGVTMHAQTREARAVAVRRLGIAPCEAAGEIERGERVCVADDEGRVKAVVLPSGLLGQEGHNGSVLYEVLAPREAPVLRVTHTVSGSSTPLAVSLVAGELRVRVGTDSEGDPVTTAAQLAAHLNASEPLNRVVRATAGGTGASVIGDDTVEIGGWEAAANAIGIAQQHATTAGDIIDVFLTP